MSNPVQFLAEIVRLQELATELRDALRDRYNDCSPHAPEVPFFVDESAANLVRFILGNDAL